MKYIIGVDEVGRAARRRASPRYVVGIDEVGRGSLAGPVVVAAVLVSGSWYLVAGRPSGKLRDSKKLSVKQREAWFAYFKNHPKISYALARVYPRTIDRINISRAANLAALRAFRRLESRVTSQESRCRIFLDGGLFLGNGEQPRNAKTVIRGDQKFTAVKIASIIAKVHRDGLMKKLAKKYPAYGFEIHKGYGTRVHLAAVKKYGPTEVHRRSFTAG